jgi:hypothetical protein
MCSRIMNTIEIKFQISARIIEYVYKVGHYHKAVASNQSAINKAPFEIREKEEKERDR